MCAHVKNARVNFLSNTRDLTIKLQDQVQLKWSANLHLKSLTLYEEITAFWKKVSPERKEKTEETPNKTPLNWAVKVNGDFQLLISMSKKHEAVVVATELAFGRTQSYAGVETVLLKIAVDDADIFTFTNLQICRQNDDQDVADERRKAEGFVLPVNRIW